MLKKITILAVLCIASLASARVSTEVLVSSTTPTAISTVGTASKSRSGLGIKNLGPNPIWCSSTKAEAVVNKAWKVNANGGTLSLGAGSEDTLWCIASTAAQVTGAGTVVIELPVYGQTQQEGGDNTANSLTLTGASLSSSNTSATFAITGSLSAASAGGATPVFRFAPTVALDTNDGVLLVEKADGTDLFKVDHEGDTVVSGSLTTSNTISFPNTLFTSSTSTGMTFVSGLNAANATSSAAAYKMVPNTALDANDLILDVQNSAGTSRFKVDTEGDIVAAGDISFRDTIANSLTTGVLTIAPVTNAATATSSSAALRIKPNTALDADDLVLDVQKSDATSLFKVDVEGDATSNSMTLGAPSGANGVIANSGAYVCLNGSACSTWVRASGNTLLLNAPTGSAIGFRINDVDQWTLNASTFSPTSTNIEDIGTAALGVDDIFVRKVTAPTNEGMLITGAADTQTTSLAASVRINTNGALTANDLILDVEHNGTVKFSVDAEGDVASAGKITAGTSFVASGAGNGILNVNTSVLELNDDNGTRFTPMTLQTCTQSSNSSGNVPEGTVNVVAGAAAVYTKVCVCRYDGTTAKWFNAFNPTATTGTTTTCPN